MSGPGREFEASIPVSPEQIVRGIRNSRSRIFMIRAQEESGDLRDEALTKAWQEVIDKQTQLIRDAIVAKQRGIEVPGVNFPPIATNGTKERSVRMEFRDPVVPGLPVTYERPVESLVQPGILPTSERILEILGVADAPATDISSD